MSKNCGSLGQALATRSAKVSAAVGIAMLIFGTSACSSEAVDRATPDTAAQREQKEFATCKEDLGSFYKAVAEVDARLSAGLAYDELQERLGDAYSAENLTPQVGGDCYELVYTRLFEVLEKYSEGQEEWRTCLQDEGLECDQDAAGSAQFTEGSTKFFEVSQYWAAGPQ